MKALSIATLAVVALLVPSKAFAQAGGYVVGSTPQTYVPLTGATPVTLSGTDDEGYANITLPFGFTYFGVTYTNVLVDTNGLMFFSNSATPSTPCNTGVTSSTCYSNTNLPTSGNGPLSATAMKTFIAPWWDDGETPAGGEIRYTTSANEVQIEYSNWDYYSFSSNTGPFNFIVRLKDTATGTNNDQIQIHYGAHTGAGPGSASVGLQDQGTQAIVMFPCTNTTSRCTTANWPANTNYFIDIPQNPELQVQSVTLSSFAVTSGNATFNYSAVVKNLGVNAGNNWFYKVFLSTDTALDANDKLAFDSSTGSASSVAGTGTVTLTGTGTVNALPVGNYYALVQVDSTDVLTEIIETDNVGATTLTYTVGIDLVATSLTGAPANAGPGDPITLTANVSNTGSVSAGTVSYAIVLSTDTSFSSPPDFVAYTGTVTLSNGQSTTLNINFNLPSNVSGGTQYFGIVLDPSNAVTEAAEGNNSAWNATQSSIRQADLNVEAVDLYDPVSSQPSRSAYMGDVREVRITVRNIGQATATGFNVGVILSFDKTLSMQPVGTDYNFQDEPSTQAGGFTLAPGAVATYTFNITMPSTTKLVGGQPLQTGDYYFFVKTDSFDDISELREDNNTKIVAYPGNGVPVRLFVQSPDVAVTKVQVPSASAVGEVVPVYRALRNVGILDAPTLPYRFYASANELITEEDVPLEIVKSDGSTAMTDNVTLIRNGADTKTDFVRLPAGMPPGNYYIGAIIDPQNTVTELNETNNGLASSTTIQIAAPAMRVTSSLVPDAIVDRPFVFQLSAAGTGTGVTWGATGLPIGLTLEPQSGIISGTPTLSGVFAFDVTATSGGRNAAARLVMRVLPNTTELAVNTLSLAPIVNSPLVAYQSTLSAAGGTKPYAWKLVSGSFPGGIALRPDGVVSGSPASGTAVGETRVTVEVTDGVGNRARASVKVRVIAPGSVMIDTLLLPNAMVNAEYISDLTAKAAAGGTLQRPLNWSVAAGALPEGLELTTQAGDRGIIQGKPFVPGAYLFTLQVEDAQGRTDSADYVMHVYDTHFKITSANIPAELNPGDDVTFNLTSGSGFQVTYDLYSGALPPGLTMDAAGNVTGRIDEDPEKSVGVYNVVVTGKDKNGGSGMGAISMEVTRRPVQEGCSAASGGRASFGFALLFAAAALLRLRRSRGALLALGGVGMLATSSPAFAQANNYFVTGPTNATYVPLTGATPVSVSLSSGAVVSVPFPFKFFGQTSNSLGISMNGYAVPDGSGDLTEWLNQAIPHSSGSYPTRGIFPWWDDIEYASSGTQVGYKTEGTAPNRVFVVEWKDMVHYLATTSKFSFQMRLFEGSSKIRFSYGPTTPGSASASTGIMGGPAVGVATMACGTSNNCTTASFPTNKEFEFSEPADLTISQLTGDDTGYANVAYRATATLRNVGGSVAQSASVRFYLSTNGSIDTSDVVLGDTTAITLQPGGSQSVSASGLIPANTAPGNYYLLAKADALNTLTEPDENNNTGSPVPLVIGSPTPDIQPIQIATTTSTAVPGQTLTIQRAFYNAGNAVTGQPAKYTYFLSDNQVASYSDYAFSAGGTIPAGLGVGAQDTSSTDTVTLPNDLPAGRYWLGVCADYSPTESPTSAVTEISEVNNCLTSSQPFVVSSGQLAILTSVLPGATQTSPYAVRLEATGGNGIYIWTLKAGSLPPGMSLRQDGYLQGSPAQAGSFSFEAQVQSGTATQAATYQLSVQGKDIPLAVVDQDLPTAEFGKAYRASLIAIGGKPPYTWTLKPESALPQGIGVASDGTVEGRSTTLGDFQLSVEVQDSNGVRAAREVRLTVSNPTQLSMKTSRLQTAYVGKTYNMPLEAAGGGGGYTWSLVRFQKLSQGPTDVPQPAWSDEPSTPPERKLNGQFPASFGLIFYADPSRQGSVALDGVPTEAGLFALTLKVTDRLGVSDITTLTLLVSYDTALAITTTALPDAFVGRPYNVRIGTNAPGNVAVTFENACVQQVAAETANRDVPGFTCASADAQQQLPPELFLGSDGSITGAPTAPGTFDGQTPMVFSFLVKAKDPQGRYDVRALAIRLRPNYQEAGGCSSTAAAPVLLAAAFALRLLRRRK